MSMSLFSRVLSPLPTTTRAYSSFFSSKPGGGRYFNSAKPPKTVIGSRKGTTDKTSAEDGAANGANNGLNGTGNGPSQMKTAKGEESSPPLVNTKQDTPSLSEHTTISESPSSSGLPSATPSRAEQFIYPRHPAMTAQDYKLHQFFSLHRPLLLHSQPISALFETPPQSWDTFLSPATEGTSTTQPNISTLDDPPEASYEADADAARQLARALVMNRVGGVISWQNTLAKLGSDGNTNAGRAELAKEWAREWETIYADSVKRKRKKKMKKHK